MNTKRRLLTLSPLLALLPTHARAAPPNVLPLWPEGVPAAMRADAPAARGELGPERVDANGAIANVSVPTLTVVAPAVDRHSPPHGTAVILCPGGGYRYLSWQHEGLQYAAWLSTLGITTFILKSRLQEWGHPAPLQDVLRAIRLVRSRAAEFGIAPNRIGVMGSSAGGHLAASASTLFDHADGRTGAALDNNVNARPDFAALVYPVITMTDPAAHAGSRRSLLGDKPSPALLALTSLEQQVSKDTPPTLLLHTQRDKTVPVDNSILYYQALTRAGVPAELYVFEQGGHGIGMRDGFGTASAWPRHAEDWLRQRGLLSAAGR
ncbi:MULTISPECIES: alpha/beta hydrolase [unclassified Roseateles]|uniref:alpha/beta hydrolase n=1 Tax=unclassified Roseateles TaxID=2626991 RepID=UPI0006FF2FA1|nr:MULTISPECIES: alpha/beta hydrolase [unclassified Roseateles]KQW46689.1 alpha/beta hydrolase [Pelomonas sp. Root405]KRA73741.1 alpha/beta hydrolase [Pelomonas sp. Root662]